MFNTTKDAKEVIFINDSCVETPFVVLNLITSVPSSALEARRLVQHEYSRQFEMSHAPSGLGPVLGNDCRGSSQDDTVTYSYWLFVYSNLFEQII